jgi:hypothetical protein
MAETRGRFDTLRVIGSPDGFAVYDTGRNKLNIMALDLFIRPGNPPLMQVAMPAGMIDVVGKALFAIVDVDTGKPRVVRRIEWADGAHTVFPEPEKAPSVVNPVPAGPAGTGGQAGSLGQAGSEGKADADGQAGGAQNGISLSSRA